MTTQKEKIKDYDRLQRESTRYKIFAQCITGNIPKHLKVNTVKFNGLYNSKYEVTTYGYACPFTAIYCMDNGKELMHVVESEEYVLIYSKPLGSVGVCQYIASAIFKSLNGLFN